VKLRPFFIVLGLALAVLASSARARADQAQTSPEQGYDLGEIQSPRAVAFGGAQVALGTSTTALYGNPANLPLARVYHFEGFASVNPESRRQTYGGGVVDSTTSRLAGGVAGSWNLQDPDRIDRTWTDLRLALGYPLGDRFSVGITGRYLRLDQAANVGPLSFDTTPGQVISGAGPILNAITFDLGATLVPLDGLRVGFLGRNLTNPGTALAPTTLQGGIGYGTELFSIEGDVLGDFTTWKSTRARYMLGGEIFLAGHVPLRLGYRYDDGAKTHALSAGLGYVEKAWSFEVGVRHDVAGPLPATLIVASVRFFYNPEGAGGSIDTSNQPF
jgi:opacity protein-like surface antigen